MMLGASSQAKQPLSLPWLDEVVRDLIQEPDLVRIKKLLIYACTQTWESNSDRIHATDLYGLLQALLTIAPTPEQLQFVLYKVANSLNKAADYLLIADAVIEPIKQRYPVPVQVTRTDSVPANEQTGNQMSDQNSYQTIAQALHQDPDEFRIRKLLLLSCKNVWMNDRYQLNRLNLSILVQEIHSLAPSIEELQIVLKNRVQKLSKSTEYLLVADKIVQILKPLYPTLLTSISNLSSEPINSTKLLPTQLSKQLPNQLTRKTQIPTAKRSNSISSRTYFQPESINWFDLRLEIIRYANPFRTKILLFSLLHELFNQTTEHHLMLKNYPLDELLKLLLQSYKSFTELGINLPQIAKQLDEPEAYRQVAQIILRATQPIYDQFLTISEISVSQTSENLEQTTSVVKATNSSSEATGPEIF